MGKELKKIFEIKMCYILVRVRIPMEGPPQKGKNKVINDQTTSLLRTDEVGGALLLKRSMLQNSLKNEATVSYVGAWWLLKV